MVEGNSVASVFELKPPAKDRTAARQRNRGRPAARRRAAIGKVGRVTRHGGRSQQLAPRADGAAAELGGSGVVLRRGVASEPFISGASRHATGGLCCRAAMKLAAMHYWRYRHIHTSGDVRVDSK